VIKRIVCLANSRKLSGRCVAGIEIEKGRRVGWIRPVSAREHEEVSEQERQYEDGSDPRVLDLLDVPLIRAQPRAYQRENWLLDPAHYWKKTGRISWSDLAGLVDPIGQLWIDGDSSFNGANDRVPLESAARLVDSLRLIRVDRIVLAVFAPGEAFDNPKRRVQGRFVHAGTEYRLWVTDPRYERKYLAQQDGDHGLGECFVTVSLGEEYKGRCYKLIAAIIERPQP
jgi:hypothetical protein